MTLLRVVLATIVGFVVLGTVRMASLLVPVVIAPLVGINPPDPANEPVQWAWLTADLGVGFAAAALGAIACGVIAGRHASLATASLAVLALLVCGAMALSAPAPGHPDWHGWTAAGLAVVGVLCGGRIVNDTRRRDDRPR
ncbi:MAG: hypothetical protein ACYTGR_02010 [Planctomycetota bacterium]|jgi:hypothetical protein